MATNKQNLQTAYTNVCQAIADLSANPRPNYSIDGRSYSWNELFMSLLDKQAVLLAAIQNSDGPFEVVTYGKTE